MHFSSILIKGVLLKRYKRFLADIQLDTGEIITAHCANSGAMLDITTPGSHVWVSYEDAPSRKLKYSWHMVMCEDVLIGMNTSLPNVLVAEAIENGTIKELQGYEQVRREVKYGHNSRIDLLLSGANKPVCYVEVKNAHLKRGEMALFPDSVTSRGAKHLQEMAYMVKEGHRAVMIYVVQRSDCKTFDLASDIDPVYAKEARAAFDVGVEAYAYDCHVSPQEIYLARPLKMTLSV